MMKNKKEIRITTILGAGSEVNGDFSAEGSARIDGKVTGNVTIAGTLIVGVSASISGNLDAESVIIGGKVLGDVTVKEKAELTATAKVFGDITTKAIVIDENAVFQGKCDMNQEATEDRTANRREVRAAKKSAKAAIAEALREVEEEEKREAEEEETV